MITEQLQRALPFEGPALDTLRSLNAFVVPRALRSYQKDLLATGSFTCPCPFAGIPRHPNAHYVLPGSGVLYYFDGPTPYILLAASLKDGFPVVCIITAHHVIWSGKKERADLIPFARKLLETVPSQKIVLTLRTRVTLGDPNFAHFMWNEFPALHEAVRHYRRFDIDLRFDPLGVMPRFAVQNGLRLRHATSPVGRKGWSRAPAVCLGSTFCNAQAKTTIMTLMDLPHTPQRRPHIWITVRDEGRTMENQIKFLNAFISAQNARAPETVFMLDGFSNPMDIERPIYDALRPKFAERVTAAQSLIAKVVADNRNAQIQDMTGLPVRDAIAAAGACNFYLSHAGTLQHKPAWFYPLHGLQHGNHASLSPAALRWSAQMVAGSIEPNGLPLDVVQDTKVNGQQTQNNRNRDYIVTDVPAAVRCVLDRMDASTAMSLAG
jgi:hypothetical protein